jgi:hypothetical protein
MKEEILLENFLGRDFVVVEKIPGANSVQCEADARGTGTQLYNEQMQREWRRRDSLN